MNILLTLLGVLVLALVVNFIGWKLGGWLYHRHHPHGFGNAPPRRPIVRFTDLIPLKVPPPGYEYACTDCGKGLTEEEADRCLIADWPHCDDCWQKLCDSLDEPNTRKGID